MGDTFRELHQLLELYAPAWYTEELHNHAEAALLVFGKVSTVTQDQGVDGAIELKPSSAYELTCRSGKPLQPRCRS